MTLYHRLIVLEFQSTLSARRATMSAKTTAVTNAISIHARREESDCKYYGKLSFKKRISIHALREESDALQEAVKRNRKIDFNPRSP